MDMSTATIEEHSEVIQEFYYVSCLHSSARVVCCRTEGGVLLHRGWCVVAGMLV